jgi:hypothetical protein
MTRPGVTRYYPGLIEKAKETTITKSHVFSAVTPGMTRDDSSKRPGSSSRRSGPLILASDSIAHQYEPAMLAAALLLS